MQISPWLVHGTLCTSQVILVVHSFVVKHSLDATTSSLNITDTSASISINPLHPPMVFAALRSAISAPILLLLYFFQSSPTITKPLKPLKPATKKEYIGAIACGFFGVFLYPLLYAFGLRSTTPTAACVCEALTPIFSLALESFVSTTTTTTKSTFSATRSFAVFLAVAGSIVMTVHGAWVDTLSIDGGDSITNSGRIIDVGQKVAQKVAGRTLGNIYVIASAAAYALFLSIQRHTLKKTNASVMFLTSFGNVFGSLFLLASAYIVNGLNYHDLTTHYLPTFFYGMIWAALITSVLGYTLEGLANSWSSPTLVAVYNAVQPFGAGILSHGIAGGKHAASGIELVAAVFVCTGVLLIKTDDVKNNSKENNNGKKITNGKESTSIIKEQKGILAMLTKEQQNLFRSHVV